METLASLRNADHRLTKRMAAWDSVWVRQLLPPVGKAAEHTKLWWAVAAAMATCGGRRGRKAAAAGIVAMAVAELLSNGVAKKLVERRRPPKEWIPHNDVEDRPDSSSFPSGHTAAAVAFTVAVAPNWPRAGTACAVPMTLVAVERVRSGAHYPSDIAAGAAIGLIAAALVRAMPRILARHGDGLSRWWVIGCLRGTRAVTTPVAARTAAVGNRQTVKTGTPYRNRPSPASRPIRLR